MTEPLSSAAAKVWLTSIPPLVDEITMAQRHAAYGMKYSQNRVIWKSALR